MRVLAIDPGYDRVGVALLEYQPQETVLYSTCIETNRHATIADRLLTIGTTLEHILLTYHPDTLAIETLFYNKNVKTALGVAQARGVILYLGSLQRCTVYEFSPQQIKVAITGNGASDKSAVTTMVKRLVRNVPEYGHDDEYDAIAVGVTCLAHYGRNR